MQESAAILVSRMSAAPRTCLVGYDNQGVGGYLFAYPSRLGTVLDLGAPFIVVAEPDTLYLHDLSIAPRANGRGLARALVDHALGLARAQGSTHAALVSVQDSARFWHGFGFAPTPCEKGLDSYPGDARYMQRSLQPL